MLPSRGLRPAHYIPNVPSRALALRPNVVSRKFSSVPRGSVTLNYRASGLRSSQWRTKSSSAPLALSIVAVRNGSWYAPWSWNSTKPSEPHSQTSGSPSDAIQVAETAAAPPPPEPVLSKESPEPVSSTAEAITPSEVPTTFDEVIDSALDLTKLPDTEIGYLHQLGLDFGWGPTSIVQWILEHVHAYSSFGWGGSIVATTIIVRVILFKSNMDMSDNAAKMAAVAPITAPLTAARTKATNEGNVQMKQHVNRQLSQIYKSVGIQTWKSFVAPITQAMMGFGAFRLIRSMTSIPVPGMLDGGWLWFKDLTVSDPYMLLPIIGAGVLHLNAKYRPDTGTAAEMKPFMQAVTLYMLPAALMVVAFWLPSALQITFVVTGLWGLGQQALLHWPVFRQFTGLAPWPSAESKEFFTRVARREIPLDTALAVAERSRIFKSAGASVSSTASDPTALKYEAPSIQSLIAKPPTLEQKIRIREGTSLPAHLQRHRENSADVVLDREPMPTGFKDKIYWFGRNMKPATVRRRLKWWWNMRIGASTQAKMAEERKKQAKKKAEEYEWRRKEAMKRDR